MRTSFSFSRQAASTRRRDRRRVVGAASLCVFLTSTLASVPAAHAATLSYSDDFQDGNANGWTGRGGPWQVCQPPGQDPAFCVSATTAYPRTFSNVPGSPGWADYSVEATVEVTGVNGGIAIIGRAVDNNHFYMLQLKQYRRTHGWFIHRRDGASGGWVDIAFGNYPWVANQQYQLKLDMQGSSLTASISADGGATYTTLGSVNDSTYTHGRIGLRAWDTTAYVDNVQVFTNP